MKGKAPKLFLAVLLLTFAFVSCTPAALTPDSIELDPNFACYLERSGEAVTITLEAQQPRSNVTLAAYTAGEFATHSEASMRLVNGAWVLTLPQLAGEYELEVLSPERLSAATTQYAGDTLYRTACRARPAP